MFIASRPTVLPPEVWTSHEDIVYALAFDSQGRLLAGTGNRGHIFAVAGLDDFSDLLKAAASQVTAFAKAPGGGLYAATSNLGKVFVLGPGPGSRGHLRERCVRCQNLLALGPRRISRRGQC